MQAGKTNADSNAVLTTAVLADLPVLSAMLSKLFESSQYLSDVALHHLIDALCKLSQEAMELAYCNRVSRGDLYFEKCSILPATIQITRNKKVELFNHQFRGVRYDFFVQD